jgi:hypothetical protein
MTLVTAVAAPDGIALAGESRTTHTRGAHHRITSDNAVKLFQVEDVGVATYGLAMIGDHTIAGLTAEFQASLPDPAPREATELATRLADFFDTRLKAKYPQLTAAQGYPLGFIVAGYNGDGIGRVMEVRLPGPDVEELFSTVDVGFAYRGQTDVCDRMIFGVDWDRMDTLGLSVSANARTELEKLEYHMIYPIALQDAIDLSAFFIRTTVDMQRFSDGTEGDPVGIPGCGGPVRVLAVTPDGALWIAPYTLTATAPAGVAEGGSF